MGVVRPPPPCVIPCPHFQALSKEQAEYCIRLMKPYKAPDGTPVPGGLDYKEFAKTLF